MARSFSSSGIVEFAIVSGAGTRKLRGVCGLRRAFFVLREWQAGFSAASALLLLRRGGSKSFFR